ncbi:unnamed protein product [Meganyctiphanes norvegica]|uniref:Uncharacterized protein n=1 Tax=Meganyctiphanes norvegica TaxID=48144 RepID=A0AAV2R1C8_MEGNR
MHTTSVLNSPKGDKNSERSNDIMEHLSEVSSYTISVSNLEGNSLEDDEDLEENHIADCDTAICDMDDSFIYSLSPGSLNNISVCDSGLGEEDHNSTTLFRVSSCHFTSESIVGDDEAREFNDEGNEILEPRTIDSSSPATSGSNCVQNPFRRELFRTLMPHELSASSIVAERTFFTVDTIGGKELDMNSREINNSELVEIPSVLKSVENLKYKSANNNNIENLKNCNKESVYTNRENSGLINISELYNCSLDSEFISLNLSEPGMYDLLEYRLSAICNSVSSKRNQDDSSDEIIEESFIPVCDTEICEHNHELRDLTKERLLSTCDSGLGEGDPDLRIFSRESSCPSAADSLEDDLEVINTKIVNERGE